VKKFVINKTLKIELSNSFRALHHSRTHLVKQIARYIPVNICNSFFTRQDNFFRFFAKQEKHLLNLKMKWLLEKY